MNWQRYQNELIVFGALVLMLMAYGYKSSVQNAQINTGSDTKQTIAQIKEVVALKEIWLDKKTTKKLAKLHKLLPVSKVKWRKKGKKIEASFKGLTARELNTFVTKMFNLAIQITKLKIDKQGLFYMVEFKCKW